MKKLTILLFSILISFSSYGEWTKVGDNVEGDVFYVDHQTVKSVSNMRYYYLLKDYVAPTEWGDLSSKAYKKVNCENLQQDKNLLINYYPEPLGKGIPTEGSGPRSNAKWESYPLSSIGYLVSEYICNLKM